MKDYQLRILKLLAKGMTQKQASEHLKNKGYKPNSVRMIEDNLRELKKEYKAKTSFHLAVILSKKGII